VRAGAGNDRVRVDESRIVFTKQSRTTLKGGRGADTCWAAVAASG
jgi:hypothetical protein